MGEEMGETTRVLIVGHSLAAGIAGIPDSEASVRSGGRREWVPVVKALERARADRIFGKLPVELDVAVKIGSQIRFAQEQLDGKKPGQYDVIIIFTGGNDVRTKKPAERIVQELESLYGTAKETLGAKKVLVFNFPLPRLTPRGISQKIRKLNDLVRESGKIPEGDVIDFSGHPLPIAAQEHWPRRHPPEEAYRMLRSVVRERIGEWLEEPRIKSIVPRKIGETARRKKEPQKAVL